jgi:hypothetical protein
MSQGQYSAAVTAASMESYVKSIVVLALREFAIEAGAATHVSVCIAEQWLS